MSENKNEKSMEELTDEALDAVSGGKSVILQECVVCGARYDHIGPDGKVYCCKHYHEKFGE